MPLAPRLVQSNTTFSAPCSWMRTFALATLLFLAGTPRLYGEALPITLDGLFADWTGAAEMTDATGDAGASGIDFVEFDFANDNDWLFLRFETTMEVGLQGGNNIVLYLDTDVNSGTGLAINGIGAELSWQFGARSGTWHANGAPLNQDDINIRQLPTVTGDVFEVAIARDAQPVFGADLFTGPAFRALLVDTGGDQVPENGMTVTYTFDATNVPDPNAIPFAREMAGDVRVVTWNTRDLEGGGLWNNTATDAAENIFIALDPEIICFQEIYNATAAQTAALVETWLPSGAGPAWDARSNNDNKIVTRYPILGSWNLDGNLAVRLDTSADWGAEALVISAHLPCCANDAGRQAESDRIMSFLRDAMTVGGLIDMPQGSVFVVTGDMNLVGFSQQLTTLRTGDIVNNGVFGADFDPDWDGTELGDARPLQSEARFAYTWRNDNSTFQPGRLDFIFYTDSVVEMGRNFVIYSPEMSPTELSNNGMSADDVIDVSDHLPVVADFRQIVASDTGPQQGSGGAHIEGLRSDDDGIHFTLILDEPARASIEIFDVRGQRVGRLQDLQDQALTSGHHPMTWSGRTTTGRSVAHGVYLLRVLTRNASGVASQATEKLLFFR